MFPKLLLAQCLFLMLPLSSTIALADDALQQQLEAEQAALKNLNSEIKTLEQERRENLSQDEMIESYVALHARMTEELKSHLDRFNQMQAKVPATIDDDIKQAQALATWISSKVPLIMDMSQSDQAATALIEEWRQQKQQTFFCEQTHMQQLAESMRRDALQPAKQLGSDYAAMTTRLLQKLKQGDIAAKAKENNKAFQSVLASLEKEFLRTVEARAPYAVCTLMQRLGSMLHLKKHLVLLKSAVSDLQGLNLDAIIKGFENQVTAINFVSATRIAANNVQGQFDKSLINGYISQSIRDAQSGEKALQLLYLNIRNTAFLSVQQKTEINEHLQQTFKKMQDDLSKWVKDVATARSLLLNRVSTVTIVRFFKYDKDTTMQKDAAWQQTKQSFLTLVNIPDLKQRPQLPQFSSLTALMAFDDQLTALENQAKQLAKEHGL